MIRRWTHAVATVFLLAVIPATAQAESVFLINRTGREIWLIQAAFAGSNRWGDDLIAGDVVPDGESRRLDLAGSAPYAFRILDDRGERYIVYGADPGATGKIVVGPEHLAGLAEIAGAERDITLINQTGGTVVSVKISPVTSGEWGPDLFAGGLLRNGETAELRVHAPTGTLTFDILFVLRTDGLETTYRKEGMILANGTRLVLSLSDS